MKEEIQNAAIIPLEKLQAEFDQFVDDVDAELESDAPLSDELPDYVVADVEGALALCEADVTTALGRRDRLAELIFAIDAQEQRVRDHVKRAEMAARHLKAMSDRMRWSILTFMLMRGLKSIPGEVSKFQVQKNPDRLVVHDESAIPDEFFDEKTVKVLNEEALRTALDSGRKIVGAEIETNRKRLAIK